MALELPKNPTLKDYQGYIRQMVKERGFENETVTELFMLFLEESGELARAARKHTAMKEHAGKQLTDVSHEMADVFIYLLELCNVLNIDLEQAFLQKEEINKQRTWK